MAQEAQAYGPRRVGMGKRGTRQAVGAWLSDRLFSSWGILGLGGVGVSGWGLLFSALLPVCRGLGLLTEQPLTALLRAGAAGVSRKEMIGGGEET